MKKIMKGKKHCVSAGAWTFFLVIVFVSSGCATTNTAPYVSNDTTRKMTTASSESHQFKYVRLEEHNGEIRLYGKIEHRHAFCEQEAHVDLVSVDSQLPGLSRRRIALRGGNAIGLRRC